MELSAGMFIVIDLTVPSPTMTPPGASAVSTGASAASGGASAEDDAGASAIDMGTSATPASAVGVWPSRGMSSFVDGSTRTKPSTTRATPWIESKPSPTFTSSVQAKPQPGRQYFSVSKKPRPTFTTFAPIVTSNPRYWTLPGPASEFEPEQATENCAAVTFVASIGPASRTSTSFHCANAGDVASVPFATMSGVSVVATGAMVVPFLVSVTPFSSGDAWNTSYVPVTSSTSPGASLSIVLYALQLDLGQNSWMPLDGPPPGSCTHAVALVEDVTRPTVTTPVIVTLELTAGGLMFRARMLPACPVGASALGSEGGASACAPMGASGRSMSCAVPRQAQSTIAAAHMQFDFIYCLRYARRGR